MTPIPYALLKSYLPESAAKVLDLSVHDYPMITEAHPEVRIYKAALSAAQAKACAAQPFEDIFCTDLARLPFIDDNFQLVLHAATAQDVLEHLHGLRECVRVLRPGGVLVGWLDDALLPGEEQELRQLMRRFGIEVLEHQNNSHFIGRKMN